MMNVNHGNKKDHISRNVITARTGVNRLHQRSQMIE